MDGKLIDVLGNELVFTNENSLPFATRQLEKIILRGIGTLLTVIGKNDPFFYEKVGELNGYIKAHDPNNAIMAHEYADGVVIYLELANAETSQKFKAYFEKSKPFKKLWLLKN